MAIRFLRIAVIYVMVGAAMGLIMGITHQFQFAPVHAHLNLLGWASLALVSLIYQHHPRAAETKLAAVHFWLHNVGLPIFMVSLFLLLLGHPAAQAGVAVGGAITLIGIQVFAVNLLRSLRGPGQSARPL